MKKITKTFYVIDSDLDRLRKGGKNLSLNFYDSTLDQAVPPNKVEITFSVPEKTISLSESVFDEAWLVVGTIGSLKYDDLKQKLFGESHD